MPMESWIPLVTPPNADPPDDALWWGVHGSRVVVGDRPETEGPPVFLGTLDGAECWAASVSDTEDGLQDLRMLHGALGEQRWAIAGRAVQLVAWEETHRFCGRCATPTTDSPGERAKVCPKCGLFAFPRLAPAVITLITKGPHALLARGVTFGVPMYSCLAGFVEPGETLEEAVVREVREEVGIEIRDVRYQSSQPWPFPHSLMLGFRAEWESGELELDPAEIVDANWYLPDDLPAIPTRISIARRLIDAWLSE